MSRNISAILAGTGAGLATVLGTDEAALDVAVGLLGDGAVVALPTETVYGLAADATRGEAVARIFEAKERPRFNPLIVHVSDIAMARTVARFDELALLLARSFWPGPLTLVLPLLPGTAVSPLVTAGLDTVAVRMPRGFAARVIERLGRPLAAPSANRSGKVSATSAAAVAAGLGDRIPLIIDGGPAPVGVESTILKVSGGRLALLRPGGVPVGEIEAAAGMDVDRGAVEGVIAPGMLASHYAPEAPLRLDAVRVEPGEVLLAFGPRRIEGAKDARAVVNLSESADMREAASRLFWALSELDRLGGSIAAEPVPAHGLGEAINDRLRRAAAPRDNGAVSA